MKNEEAPAPPDRHDTVMGLSRLGGTSTIKNENKVAPNPQLLLHKLRALHSEARSVYGLDLFTAFLGEGGTKIETVVNCRDAAIAKVMMDRSAKQCQLAVLNSLKGAEPPRHQQPRAASSQHLKLEHNIAPSEHHALTDEERSSRSSSYSNASGLFTQAALGAASESDHHEGAAATAEKYRLLRDEDEEEEDGRRGEEEEDEETEEGERGGEREGEDHEKDEKEKSCSKEAPFVACGMLEGDDEKLEGNDENLEGDVENEDEGGVQQPAPPGLGAAALWAREAASLKRKIGARDGSTAGGDGSPLAKRTTLANPMPTTNKELAVLIRDVVGARPKYGDESARPAYWPEDVPWQKGKSISQMNNVTLRRLARAVLQHQEHTREIARASGSVVPDGVLGCAQRTKKELSALIRSKLGLRLQYGERKKRPGFWPSNVPWVKGKPLSMMNHAQLSSVFAAMVGAGLCPAGACLEPELMDSDGASDTGSGEAAEADQEDGEDEQDDDDTTAEDRSDVDSSRGHEIGAGDGGDDGRLVDDTAYVYGSDISCNILGRFDDAEAVCVGVSQASASGSLTEQDPSLQAQLQHLPMSFPPQHLSSSDSIAPPSQHSARQPNEIPVPPARIPSATFEEMMGGGNASVEVSAGDLSGRNGTLLPTFPSLESFSGLPLTSPSEDELSAFGTASTAAFADAVMSSRATSGTDRETSLRLSSAVVSAAGGGTSDVEDWL